MRPMSPKLLKHLAPALVFGLVPGVTLAAAPEPWQMNFQPAASPVMEQLATFHGLLLWIITLITLFVLGLIGYASWRFSEKRNPVPSRRSHHAVIEVLWTAVPVLILVIIAIPSFKLLYFMDVVPAKTDLTIKAIGRQWYWSYEYPDHGSFTFDANMIADADIKPGQYRLLETDYQVVLPVEKTVRIQVSGSDVLHSWAMPSMGIKVDAVPGRLNEGWIRIAEPGIYYGQCSELCGINHGFMPIAIRAVPQAEFEAWVKQAQQEFARVEGGRAVASAGAAPRAAVH
jgi:cytochrome c oxidase subunit 2